MNASPAPPAEISPLDWYHLFRSRIEHEDNLIVQRLSWLVASQSFLFTAYAIATNGLSSSVPHGEIIFINQEKLLLRLIPVVAVSNAILIFISILAALKAIHELRRDYPTHSHGTELPPIQTSAITRSLGLSAPVLLPLLFVAVWLFLLTHSLS